MTTSATGIYTSVIPSIVTVSNYPITLNPPIQPVTISSSTGRPQDGQGDYTVTIGSVGTYIINITNNVGTIKSFQIPNGGIAFPLTLLGTHPVTCTEASGT